MTEPARCPVCLGGRTTLVLDLGEVPVSSCVQIDDRAAALAFPRGRLELAACADCGHLFNAAFAPERVEYSARYEETQSHSPTFRAFHAALAADLVERHRLRGRRVLEIGCGKGEFLDLLIDAGVGACLGFDPGFDPARAPRADGRVEVRRTFYGPEQAGLAADFFVCKMTLEHVHAPRALLDTLRRACAGRAGTGLFFLVPDAGRIVAEGAFEDVYYEHCGYFTRASLAGLFTRAGFTVTGLDSLYGGQYLGLHACPTGAGVVATPAPAPLDVAAFANRLRERVAGWRGRVADWTAAGQSWAVWGGGSKAVAFLGALGRLATPVAVVDINPRRQGAWLPGLGLPVVAPAALTRMPPAHVVVMNALYREEVAATLAGLGLAPALHAP